MIFQGGKQRLPGALAPTTPAGDPPITRRTFLTCTTLVFALAASVVAEDVAEPGRPGAPEVKAARKLLGEQDAGNLALIGALRYLLLRTEDDERLPGWRRQSTLAALGATRRDDEDRLPGWAQLRLAAALRAGVPGGSDHGGGALDAELESYLGSALPDASDLSAHSLEMVLIEAVRARSGDAAGGVSAEAARRADERQASVAAGIPWPAHVRDVKQPAPILRVEDLFHEALLRAILRRRGLTGGTDASAAGFGRSVIESLTRSGSQTQVQPGSGWSAVAARTLRERILLGAICALARPELDAACRQGCDRQELEKGRKAIAEMTSAPTAESGIAWLYSGDGAVLVELLDADLLPAELRGVGARAAARAISPRTAPWQRPRSEEIGLAQALGWVPATAWQRVTVQESGARPAPPRRELLPAEMRERTEIASLALAVLGASGGLIAAEPRAVIPAEALAAACDALTTLELSEAPLSFDARVADALDRAAGWLRRLQAKDGSFPGQFSGILGGHALVLLAMSHAGVDRRDKAMRRGLDHLHELHASSSASSQTYSYGITLMLLQSLYEEEERAAGSLGARDQKSYLAGASKFWRGLPARDRRIIQEMISVLTEDYSGAGWGYNGAARGKDAATSRSDNSNSCYALLGLKAASYLGVPYDRKIFKGELARFRRYYVSDGRFADQSVALDGESSGSTRVGRITPGGWIYVDAEDTASMQPTRSITANVLSGLALSADELAMFGVLDDEQAGQARMLTGGALTWLGACTDYPSTITDTVVNRGSSDGNGPFYELYGLERACVLTGARRIGGIDWYQELATTIMDAQEPDGSWPDVMRGAAPQMCNASFMILVLSRAAVPTHNRPEAVITEEAK